MIFEQDHRRKGPRARRVYAIYEILYTLVDFVAALLFIIGSIFFFFENLVFAGTWFFLIGSICFVAKPTIRLTCELRLMAMGDVEEVAERLEK